MERVKTGLLSCRRTAGVRRCRAGALLIALLGAACGPTAAVEPVPPGYLEFDFLLERAYRDGARVEHVAVPEQLERFGLGDLDLDEFAACYYLNDEGLTRIESTLAALDPDGDYSPGPRCPGNTPIDIYGPSFLYIPGLTHSPFECTAIPCGCHERLAPVSLVYQVVQLNRDGLTPTDEAGNDLWYLDTTRTCTPGTWRDDGS